MLEILNRFILYTFNDSAIGFYVNNLRYLGADNYINSTSFDIFSKNLIDFLPTFLSNYLSQYIPFIFLNNLLLITAFLLNYYIGYKLFNTLTNNKYLSIVFSLFNATSLYFVYRAISATPALYFTFVITLIVYLLVKQASVFKLVLANVLAFLVSGYYGYFSFITVCLWYLVELITLPSIRNKIIRKLSIYIGTTLLILVIIFPKLVIGHLLVNNNERPSNTDSNITIIERPIEDWYSFSFRPWYFILPPQDSLFFGDLSENIYETIASTKYYLNDDYNDQEMGGSYLGWHFIAGWFFCLLILIQARKNQQIQNKYPMIIKSKSVIITLTLLILLIIGFNGPPVITVSGFKFYTPSYLMFNLVPFFRSLVRWSSVIYLLILLINSIVAVEIFNKAQTKLHKTSLLLVLLIVSYLIFAIKLPLINTSNSPKYIDSLKYLSHQGSKVAVYPTANYDSIFWISSTQNMLINPRDLEKDGVNISDEYFKEIISNPKYLPANNIEFLIYFQNDVSNKTIKRINKIKPDIKSKEQVKSTLDEAYGTPLTSPEDDIFIYRIEQIK